ncbi:ER membrane chaperone for multipass membrane proteins, PAT complex subunit, and TMCO1 translocon subunit (human CCDC47 ortholog) [Schizosaccharomyces pombe]|uniref:UPF0674 endoplasmic reticulum membrane protein C2G5.01 n=1 Tax=Schizosaccharomyces pombe (strain 972 / ATCC 24843) TaxID=284812 RepID=YGX1_SCHPO|nr:uncharacterized protein SPBC2G5.01 [Schizosaccharomyces pombe]O94280.1 RecName: Full=UPF0674 endoplasmic reticulum membrane protein C2G5.01 [Schizosaccharomyces pombe 972h-]CAA21877.1 DUF1682 family protein [Schizosaccharomyces pombe]|eukprot:NP_596062.1 uncharacterized protein SPBC2G5.01 [Schizosaccharomyces pombe]
MINKKLLFLVFALAKGVLADEEDEYEEDYNMNPELENPGMFKHVDWRDFRLEFVILACFFLYVFSFITQKKKNQKIASRWYGSLQSSFRQQFAQYGPGPNSSPIIYDSPTEFSSYLTGRLNVKNVYTTLQLFPRQDLLAYSLNQIVEILLGNVMSSVLPVADRFQFDLTLADQNLKAERFVFAIVHKDCMRILREIRYDLSFTRISSSPYLPETHVLMSENNECSQAIFEIPEFMSSINECIENLEYFIVTDQPSVPPATEKDYVTKPRIEASIRIKKITSLSGLSNATGSALFNSLLLVADSCPKFQWRPEVSKKLTSARKLAFEQVVHASAAKAAKKKVKSSGDISKLSESDQKKRMERERQRKMRRRAKKM